jgi:hypothetical protein
MINKRPEDIQGKTNREIFPQESADYYSEGEQRVGQAVEAGRSMPPTVWKERFLPREVPPGKKSLTAAYFLAF